MLFAQEQWRLFCKITVIMSYQHRITQVFGALSCNYTLQISWRGMGTEGPSVPAASSVCKVPQAALQHCPSCVRGLQLVIFRSIHGPLGSKHSCLLIIPVVSWVVEPIGCLLTECISRLSEITLFLKLKLKADIKLFGEVFCY